MVHSITLDLIVDTRTGDWTCVDFDDGCPREADGPFLKDANVPMGRCLIPERCSMERKGR